MSEAKHLGFSRSYKDEILRLRLRMTLQCDLLKSELRGPVKSQIMMQN